MPSLIWVNQFALLPGDGGGTRHFELGRELVRKDWQVTILASDLHVHTRKFTRRASTDRTPQSQIQDGVEMKWLWSAPYQRNNWQRAWNWVTFHRSVVQQLQSFTRRPDVIIGSSPQIFAASAARRLARRAGAPFVFEVRDLWPESLLAVGGRRGPAYHYIDHVAKGLYRDADKILVLARGTAEYLVRCGVPAEKIVHVPNGVDIGVIRPAADSASAQSETAQRPFTLIYAGAHGPANGLDRVLDAAAILQATSAFRFVFVGDGPAKAALQQDAARRSLSNVEFLAAVPKPDLVALLNAADAGLMVLKDAELFAFGVSPNKLFDYLAATLPVVCNVPGEVAHMLAESGAGIQAADSSARALADAILALAKLSPAERKRKGDGGRAWVEREHSREVLGNRLDAFLRDLVKR